MLNTTIASPDVAILLANDHIRALLEDSRRNSLTAPLRSARGNAGRVRQAIGSLMIGAGGRIAGRATTTTLVRQPVA